MSKNSETAAMNAIHSFHNDISAAKQRHASLIAELEAEMMGVAYELSDEYMNILDELSADLGAKAANECESKRDQEQAISQCESFVSNDVSSHAMTFVSAVVAFSGPEKASELINKVISESPVRADFGAGR